MGNLSHATAARDRAKSPEMYRCGLAQSTRTKWLYRDWPFCMYWRLRSARSYRPTLTAMPLLFGRDGDADATVIQPASKAVIVRMSDTASSLPTVSIKRFAFSRDQ